MRNLIPAAFAVAAMGAALTASAPAQAQVGLSISIPGIAFSYSSGGYCDRWGCPDEFWDYPVSYCPVYYGGSWYRGPAYYRVYRGRYQYWIRGAWRYDSWNRSRPNWACVDRYGPPLGLDFYITNGFSVRDDWRRRWDRDRNDWNDHRRNWDRDNRGRGNNWQQWAPPARDGRPVRVTTQPPSMPGAGNPPDNRGPRDRDDRNPPDNRGPRDGRTPPTPPVMTPPVAPPPVVTPPNPPPRADRGTLRDRVRDNEPAGGLRGNDRDREAKPASPVVNQPLNAPPPAAVTPPASPPPPPTPPAERQHTDRTPPSGDQGGDRGDRGDRGGDRGDRGDKGDKGDRPQRDDGQPRR